MSTDNKHQVTYNKRGYAVYRGYTVFNSTLDNGTLVAENYSRVFAKNLEKMIDEINKKLDIDSQHA